MNAAYSDLKVAWHLDRIDSLRNTGRCVPAQIQLVLSDLCNHDCSFCAYRMTGYTSNANFGEMTDKGFTNNPNRRIPTAKAKEIIKDAAEMGVLGIQFTGGGEPTVHRDHIEVFEYALSLGLKCSLVTNGSKLADGWRQVLPRFSWIRVSLDAGTPTTYERIRRVRAVEFYRTLDHIRALADTIHLEGSACSLGVSFIVTKDNLSDIELSAVEAHAHGAHSIRYAAMFSPELADYYAEDYPEIKRRIASTIGRFSGTKFEVIDLFGQRLGDLNARSPKQEFCGYQHMNVYVGADLNMYRCCNTAYNPVGLIGSLKHQSLLALTESMEADMKYKEFDARKCAHCAFHGKNEVLAYLVDREPQHVEFA